MVVVLNGRPEEVAMKLAKHIVVIAAFILIGCALAQAGVRPP
jgi:hypothetical protein